MKKTLVILSGILIILLGITGFFVYKTITRPPVSQQKDEEVKTTDIVELDKSITVSVAQSKAKDNTVILLIKGMKNSMSTLEYELSYESQGLVRGVNNGSKPIDISGKDEFEREIYLGTCSRNVCKPDVGVTKVTLVLEFMGLTGKKSQFNKDFDL
jgi:hypothetical protein